MSRWVTYNQAADILDCHPSNVAKLVSKGQLRSRGTRGGSLSRRQVEILAQRRAEVRKAWAARHQTFERVDPRPDHEHDWRSVRQVAALLGVTKPAVMARIHRERLPAVENGGRYWIRMDHLEMVEASRLATKTRRP